MIFKSFCLDTLRLLMSAQFRNFLREIRNARELKNIQFVKKTADVHNKAYWKADNLFILSFL